MNYFLKIVENEQEGMFPLATGTPIAIGETLIFPGRAGKIETVAYRVTNIKHFIYGPPFSETSTVVILEKILTP